MWNQNELRGQFYENDKWERFKDGTPPGSSADWGWVQHMAASLKTQGRAAIVLDTGRRLPGLGEQSSSNREKTIRQAFVETDWIEGVVLLPDNLFYNTSAPGIILLLNKAKPAERRGQMLLVNASNHFIKEKPKNAADGRGHRGGGRGLPRVGDAGEAEPGDHPGRGPGGRLQPEPVVVCGCE